MLAGELYLGMDADLLRERQEAQRILARFNGSAPDDAGRRGELLEQLLGCAGEGLNIQPPLACDYGTNIRIGRIGFINYGCVFLDCAPIEIGVHPEVQLSREHLVLFASTRSHQIPAPFASGANSATTRS